MEIHLVTSGYDLQWFMRLGELEAFQSDCIVDKPDLFLHNPINCVFPTLGWLAPLNTQCFIFSQPKWTLIGLALCNVLRSSSEII